MSTMKKIKCFVCKKLFSKTEIISVEIENKERNICGSCNDSLTKKKTTWENRVERSSNKTGLGIVKRAGKDVHTTNRDGTFCQFVESGILSCMSQRKIPFKYENLKGMKFSEKEIKSLTDSADKQGLFESCKFKESPVTREMKEKKMQDSIYRIKREIVTHNLLQNVLR